MSKRKQKQRRRSSRPMRRPIQSLEATFEQADHLIAQGNPQQAVKLLEPLLVRHPRESELHYYLGYAHVQAGDLWDGLAEYERAAELSGDLDIHLPLGALYLEAELHVHALRVWRLAIRQAEADPMINHMRRTMKELEQGVLEMAQDLGLEPQKAEEAKYQMEIGRRALSERDYAAAIVSSRRATELAGTWPPPHNNLALALFYDGQPEQAIATCRQVIEWDAHNIHALGNGIRFLTWTGRKAEARPLWDRLRMVTPQLPIERVKIAEAAGDMEEDERVYQTLNPSDGPPLSQVVPPRHVSSMELMLAIAEANTGRRRQAIRRLERLQKTMPKLDIYLDALHAGKPGLGWAERFSYISFRELLPEHEMEAFVNLAVKQEDIQEQHFRRQVERFVSRYPQIVRAAEQLIWETELPDLGIPLLAAINTPAAHTALRRFALSQAGEDDARMHALAVLGHSRALGPGEWIDLWLDGRWQRVQLREYDLIEAPTFDYDEAVADLLDQGLAAMQQGDNERAERLYRQVLELEPRARQAYNNLGVIYQQRGDNARAREMFEAALEVDPTYVFPRCTLANDLLNEGDVDGAEEMLKPLAQVTQMQPIEMSFYTYTQARIHLRQGNDTQARRALEAALHYTPDYAPAQELLARVQALTLLRKTSQSLVEEARRREHSARVRLQAKLSTLDPTLAEALSIYTKDALVGMARIVLPWGGWSSLRKAELVDEIVSVLQDREHLQQIVAELDEETQNALRQVLIGGGQMPWVDFDAVYATDLEESPYWNFHLPETTMGRLRVRGLLVETTVDGELQVVIPADLRAELAQVL